MNKYSVIFFDLDNTLLDFYKSEKTAIRTVLEMHSLPATDEVVKLYSEINRSYWEAFERGDIKREEIFEGRFKTLLEHLQLQGDTAAIANDYFECLAAGHDLMDGATEILAWLKAKGISIYATTNGIARTQYRRIKESGLEPFFDGVFISEEVGSQKPEREYFDYVMKNIPNVKRKEILVIGDSMSSDILGGINAGLDTCWLAPWEEQAKYPCNYRISNLYELKNLF